MNARYRPAAARAIASMVQGKAPFDAKAALQNAEVVAFMSHLPWQAFGPGTDLPDSHAKPEIWKEMDKFKADADKLQQLTPKLVAAAKTRPGVSSPTMSRSLPKSAETRE